MSAASVVKDGIKYRQLEKSYDADALYDFNAKHGTSVSFANTLRAPLCSCRSTRPPGLVDRVPDT